MKNYVVGAPSEFLSMTASHYADRANYHDDIAFGSPTLHLLFGPKSVGDTQ